MRFAIWHILAVPLTLYTLTAFAQAVAPVTKKSKDLSGVVTITYGSPTWNLDSTKVDSAVLIVRDQGTGKLLQVQLEETEPDSSEFQGRFRITFNEGNKTGPEVFIAPKSLRDETGHKKIFEAIESNALLRKPTVMTSGEHGQKMLDVFDTQAQAEAALKAAQEKRKIESEIKTKNLLKPIPTASTLAAAAKAEQEAKLAKLALDAANRQAERVRLEQIERQKVEERARQAKLISEAEKAKRTAMAGKLAEEASKLYAAGDFVDAEKKFQESVNLDPENKSYFFKYGVTLYRNKKYNEALVTLKLATVEPSLEIEKKYYVGLAHYRLDELDASLKNFSEIAADPKLVMAPSSLFYMGVINFSKGNFEAAKKSFETVIDISTDPGLDQQAEDYLDRVANALLFKKMAETKWLASGTVGMMYDSNLLLAPDNAADQGKNSNISDARLLTNGEIAYRSLFTEKHEWNSAFNASLTNSAKSEGAKADPFIYNFSSPYTYKGILFKKGLRSTVKPAYEMLFMDTAGTGSKTMALSSLLVTFDNTFIMSNSWFSTYTFEVRLDDSKTLDSVGPENADATKYSLRTNQSYFMDKAKKEAIMGNLGYVLNAAKGYNKKTNRYELGANYIRPIQWGASLILGLNAYKLSYPTADAVRNDLNLTFTTGISKPIRDWVTWGLTGTYTKNNSNMTNFTYTKYMLMTTATFNTSF